MMTRTVSVLWFRGLLQAAEALGIARGPLLQASGVTEELLRSPYARIPLEQNLQLWRSIEQQAPVADVGLRIGELVKPGYFQLFALTLMHNPDMETAFARSMRYTRLLSDGGQYYLQQGAGIAAICYEPLDSSFSRHQVDAVLVLLRNFANWLACRPLALKGVELRHAEPAAREEYERIFAAPLVFGASRNALLFDDSLMQEPLSLTDASLAQMHEQMLEAQLALLQQPDTAGLVRHFLRSTDQLGLDRDQLADCLHMSSRTLQRKLQECGTSYQQLLDEERNQRARRLLQQTRLSLTHISEQLGFSESSVFSRAFRRWNGLSPQEFRQQGPFPAE